MKIAWAVARWAWNLVALAGRWIVYPMAVSVSEKEVAHGLVVSQ